MGYNPWEDSYALTDNWHDHELAMEQPNPYPEEIRKCWPAPDELEMVEEAQKAMGVEDGDDQDS